MSIRQLRARLDRLSRSDKSKIEKPAPYHTIDPALAKALRDDNARLDELVAKKNALSQHGGTLNAAEMEEEDRLHKRIAGRILEIRFPDGSGPNPDGYGWTEQRKDKERLDELHRKRLSSSSCGDGSLTEAEDAEEAVVMARIAACEEYGGRWFCKRMAPAGGLAQRPHTSTEEALGWRP